MKKILLPALLAFGTTGCTTRLVDFTAISSKNLKMPGERGPRVTGEDCVWMALTIPIGSPDMKEAIDNAIESAGPGFNALENGVVEVTFWTAILTGKQCYVVEGTAVKVSEGGVSDEWMHSDFGQNVGLL